MSKYELLNYLSSNINYFKNISLNDFNLLANLEPSELGLMNYDNYRVTPLLQQICKYTLVDTNLTQEDIFDIENYLSSDFQQKYFEDALIIACICRQYVDNMLQEGANHPCLVNSEYLRKGAFIYSEIMEIMCELVEYANDRFQDDLMDFGNIVDEKIINIADNMWNNLLQTIEKCDITSGTDMLNNISDYIKNILVIGNFFPSNPSYIYYIGDNYVQFVDRKNIYSNSNISIGDCINSLSVIIGKAHKYYEFCNNSHISKNIEKLEEAYSLYNSYRYLYIKNQYRENKMLKECKKM